jgi:SNF2 family DNA or RNA helicase
VQIEKHVNLKYLTDRKPLIFEFQKKDTFMTVDKAEVLCKLRKSHAPTVFIDRSGTRPLPSANFLAMFDIVITTTQRFMNEWKNGSLQNELDRSAIDSQLNSSYVFENTTEHVPEACELLKVHWHRMVVDEGHTMGNDKTNSSIQFASWINSKRR